MSEGCEKTLLVQAEFDGELDAAAAASLATHRESCAQCRETWAMLAKSRSAMAEATRHEASAALRERLAQALAAATPHPNPPPQGGREFGREVATASPPLRGRDRVGGPSRRGLWLRMGGSFAAGAALAASLALALIPTNNETSLVAAVVDDHVRALQPGHLEDVVSTDQHTVKPWFDGRLDFAPPVKDLKSQGFPLLGGRLDYLEGHAVAALAYGRDQHRINLFVWPARPGGAAPLDTSRNGYNVIHWDAGGMSLWAVSDLEASQLQTFVEDWRRAE